MINSKTLTKEILGLTTYLIELGISSEQNYPSQKEVNGYTEIEWSNRKDLSIALKNTNYNIIYDEMEKNKNFNVKLLDGALIQMMYRFKGNELVSHRLAFYPSPYLEDYQNDPDTYDADDLFSDILSRQIIPIPIRFDYDIDLEKFKVVHHPISHMTIGQYKNCRIPVSSAISPTLYIDFILRNFYFDFDFPIKINLKNQGALSRTIDKMEESILHFNII